MKYCKFKSVDISKCINNGTTPKRGNPNEKNEEDELEKELNMMNKMDIQNQQRKFIFYLVIFLNLKYSNRCRRHKFP